MVDLGLAAKVRPCLVLSTSTLRQSRFEIAASPKFLRPGAFDAQGIVTVPTIRLMNRLGTLSTEQIQAVEKGVCLWLGINIAA